MRYKQLKQAQPQVVRLLEQNATRGRIVHMYLFHGEKGSFMKEAAAYCASLILNQTIGELNMDILKTSEVVWIEAEKDTIKKEQIQTLIHDYSLTSEEKKIFIINHIDQASLASSNSLLKFLEEANASVYGILLTENINQVLPTIQSRCQIIRLSPIQSDALIEELTNNNIPYELAASAAVLTNNIEEANELIEDKTFIQIYNLAKNLCVNFENEALDSISVMSEQGLFLMKEGSRRYHNYFVDLLIHLQNEKIKYLMGNKDGSHYSNLFSEMTFSLDIDQQIKILEIVMELKAKIKYNINMELAYLEMLIKVKRC